MRCGASRRTSPSCRSYWAKLDARAFSSASWVSASRSQNLASVSHAHLSSPSLQVFASRRHALTSMRLLLLLSDIGQLAYPRRAYRIVSPSGIPPQPACCDFRHCAPPRTSVSTDTEVRGTMLKVILLTGLLSMLAATGA